MTSTNFTIDNINPLIQYAPATGPGIWTEGNDATDSLGVDYSNGGTFTLCTTQGSSATFVFNGTQVFVNGAKRSNHGPYSITLDGTQTLFNGFSENAIFGPLFVSPVLAQGQHTVTLTNQLDNTSFPFLDLDFITWTSTIPDNGESKSIEDTDSSFAYNPPSSWGTDLSTLQLTGFSSNNGHTTQTTGASVTVSFSGTFISIFGPVGPHIAPYTVQLDGVNGGIFNATKQAYYPQVALYSASGLADGPHTLELISQPSTSGQALAIDYVQVSPSSTPNATTLSGDTTSTSIGNKSSSSVGPAVGGVIGGIVVLGVLFFLFFFLRRRNRRRDQHANQILLEDKYSTPTPFTMGSSGSVPYATNNTTTASQYSAPSQAQYSAPSQVQLVPHGSYTDGSASPPLTNPYSGIASESSIHGDTQRRTYYTVNDESNAGGSAPRMSMSDTMSVGHASTMRSAGAAGLGAGGGNAPRTKGGPLPLPPTANVPLPVDAPRMYVPGREQDMGPLPPDYDQATEPYHGSQ